MVVCQYVSNNPDPPSFPPELTDQGEDSTAIVTMGSIGRLLRSEPKDRHLLVRLNGAGRGHVTPLTIQQFKVGRALDSDVVVADDGVSRKHAVLIPIGGAYVIEDCDSANGTFVSGQRVDRQVLRDGDTLQFGPTAMFRYTVTDIGQETLLRQLFEASVTDALTGAHNREFFDTQLASELSFARRHKTEVSLVLFDIDHFKRVNDTYGHQAGDEVLICIAQAVRPSMRNEDVFCRYGGEEFAVILRGVNLTGARSCGERLRDTIAALTIGTGRGPVRVTISVGCAAVGSDYDVTSEALLGTADRRLYAAKHGGRNRVVIEG